MIYTNMSQIERYLGLSAPLDTAIRYLKEADLTKLVMGRNEVDGDNVFINRFDYDTLPQDAAAWEGHLQYADLHVVLSGQEQSGVTDAARLREIRRDEAADFVGFEGPVECWAPMRPGDLLIVFPEDVHMVKVQYQGPSHVEKAVFKIKA